MKTVSPSVDLPFVEEFNAHGISWPAVIGGAFVAAAFALALTFLGVGFGALSVSPWHSAGASSKAIGTGAIIWMIVTQIIAMSLGGFFAGRLRSKWSTVHSDEVYFRDTAHGLLVWAVAVVATAAFLTSAITMIAGGTIKTTPTAAAAGAYSLMPGGSYQTAPARPGGSAMLAEGGGETGPKVPPGSPGTGAVPGEFTATTPGGSATAPGATPGSPGMQALPQPGPPIQPTPEDLDKARKAVAKAAIWMFIALLIGAFCAAIAALIGGRQRDSLVYYEYDVETLRRGT